MNRQNFSEIINRTILILLTIQISIVSISIAISSIAFGLWTGLWLIQIFVTRKIDYDKKLFSELRLVNLFIISYIFFETLSRFFAVYPEGAFANLKKLLLFLIFYVSIIKITGLDSLTKIIIINLCAVSLISIYELILYALKFNELVQQMNFTEIRIDYFNYPLTGGEIKMMVILSILPLLFVRDKFLISKKISASDISPGFYFDDSYTIEKCFPCYIHLLSDIRYCCQQEVFDFIPGNNCNDVVFTAGQIYREVQ